AARTLTAVRQHADRERPVGAPVGAQPGLAVTLLEPVVGEPGVVVVRVLLRPRPVLAGVQEPGSEAGLALRVSQAPRREALGGRVPPDRVVLVATLAAKCKWQQQRFAVTTGSELLGVHRDVPLRRVLGGGVDRVALADELVQPEGEQRAAARRVTSLAARQERAPQRPLAHFRFQSR